jgi:hypothetical protein
VSDYDKFEQNVLQDFDKILDPESSEIFKGIDVGFYTLGVIGIRMEEGMVRKIEHDYLNSVAKYAKAGGCQHFHYMSGALVKENAKLLAGRLKAQNEVELVEMGFPRVSIYRPWAILTKDNSGGMVGTFSVSVMRLLDHWNYISVEAEAMGNAIVANTFRETDKPSEILTNAEIVKMGKELAQLRVSSKK